MQINYSIEQKSIFNWFIIGTGNLIVSARAGAAKTSTIIEGLNRANARLAAYLVFNKKNQIEATGKITNANVTVRTLHSLGFSLVMANWRGVRGNGYTEYQRIKTLVPDAPKQVIFQTAKLVSYLKNVFIAPTLKEATDTAILRGIDCGKHDAEGWTQAKIAELALQSLEVAKEYPKDKNISFDDMVWLPVAMGWVKPQFNLICVDETQDMNLPQLAMAVGSCNVGGRICLVGDEYQAIYGFRGAMQNSLAYFEEKLNAKKLTLTTSYRCPKSIVALAQALVPDIKAQDCAIDGSVTSMKEDSMLKEVKVKDVILSRTNAPMMKICFALLRAKVPAYVEGKDLGKTLIAIVDSFQAISISDFYDKLEKWAAARTANTKSFLAASVAELVNDQKETLRVIAETCLEVKDIELKINSLFQDADGVRVPSVVLSTVHKAKGLEWSNVFMLMETFASKRQMTPEQAQEEKNIMYVALTRSKNRLVKVSEFGGN